MQAEMSGTLDAHLDQFDDNHSMAGAEARPPAILSSFLIQMIGQLFRKCKLFVIFFIFKA
jgi:hypothetical protein